MWAMVHYVRSLIELGAQERVEQRRRQLRAARVSQPLPGDPSDAEWERIDPTFVALMPLWWRDDRVEGVEVRAAHDGENLAIHLSWNDTAENADQLHVTAFGDGAAVQLSNDNDPPFFGMGDAAARVNIWHWKSAWEDNRPSFPDITKAYPRALMDFDMSAKEIQPSQGAHLVSEVKDRDPIFYSGWGGGNLLSNPERPSVVEDLNAQGLGTVHSQTLRNQSVQDSGVWNEGGWRVVFVRPLSASGSGDVAFRTGESVRIAFDVSLFALSAAAWPIPKANTKKDSTFLLEAVPAETYRLEVQPLPPGTYLKALRVGGQRLPRPELTVPEDSPLAGVQVVLAFDAATVTGQVRPRQSSSREEGSVEARVALVPKPSQGGYATAKEVEATPDGSFSFYSVVPGAYTLYALPSMSAAQVMDPAVQSALRPYARAVDLEPEKSVTVELRLAPDPEGLL